VGASDLILGPEAAPPALRAPGPQGASSACPSRDAPVAEAVHPSHALLDLGAGVGALLGASLRQEVDRPAFFERSVRGGRRGAALRSADWTILPRDIGSEPP
jgi:hypothetical protein